MTRWPRKQKEWTWKEIGGKERWIVLIEDERTDKGNRKKLRRAMEKRTGRGGFLLFSGCVPVATDGTFSPKAPAFKGSCLRTTGETQHTGATVVLPGCSLQSTSLRGRGAHGQTLRYKLYPLPVSLIILSSQGHKCPLRQRTKGTREFFKQSG